MARKKDENARRKTIMLDVDNRAKLQMLQASMIEKSTTGVSFSRVVEEMLRRYYKL
jgi:hypothetical protein